jgi:hypothetical protein
MADARVSCITKPQPHSPVEHITHLGGSNWKWTREQVIASIEAGTNTFFVIDSRTGQRANVRVVRPSTRAPYVRTSPDGDLYDNLLSLPQCL